ncbi:MAG: short-chain dehydrogenase [Porticoccaceae bacterium]|nr:short-chain dehydrogenase [Porticoccaceae bacterium]
MTALKDGLVTAASGGIGDAMVRTMLSDPILERVFAVSSVKEAPEDLRNNGKLNWIRCDYSSVDIAKTANRLLSMNCNLVLGAICNGILHDNGIKPEKRMDDIQEETLNRVFTANAIVPILWVKELAKVFSKSDMCSIAILSARVGSISDNRLGGWYSYRASKSALNMLLKTSAIELNRKHKNVKLISFHPGTTDTKLSRPFQSSVSRDKLFTPDFVATKLMDLMRKTDVDGELSYLDWAGVPIDW